MILATDDYDDIEAYIAEHAPDARLLEAITAELDADYHTVWVDGQDVWHAWAYPGQDTWHLDKEPAREALEWLREQLLAVFDRLAAPERYGQEPGGSGLVERDEAVMEEYYDVELAAWGCPGDPVATDRRIVDRIAAARAEVARLSSLRAHHLRRAWQGDGDRGWQTRAAQSLGISPQAITKVLSSDDRRASARRRAARLRGWLSG